MLPAHHQACQNVSIGRVDDLQAPSFKEEALVVEVTWEEESITLLYRYGHCRIPMVQCMVSHLRTHG